MKALLLILAVLLITLCSAQDACVTCSTAYASCTQANPTNICGCFTTYLSCWQSSSCDSNIIAGSCAAMKPACSSLNCPAATGCSTCTVDYATCLETTPVNTCGCITALSSCQVNKGCPGATSQTFCSSYGTLCPALNCPPATGCDKCTEDFTTCATQTPAQICTCLNSLITCTSGASCGTSVYDSSCPIYQVACPNMKCSTNATGCTKCSVDYLNCAINGAKTGLTSVCSCMSTMFSCLSGDTCGLAPFNSVCGMFSGMCSNMQCSSSGSSHAASTASQISAIVQQYKGEIAHYVETALQGANITFGEVSARGAAQVVPIQLIISDAINQTKYISELLDELATYFKVERNRLTFEITQKRSNVNGNLVIENAPASSTSGASQIVVTPFVMVAVTFVLLLISSAF